MALCNLYSFSFYFIVNVFLICHLYAWILEFWQISHKDERKAGIQACAWWYSLGGNFFQHSEASIFFLNKHICILKSEFIDLHACNKIIPRPTCFDGVFQCSATADQDVVQSRRFVLQLPVVHLKQLVRIMKINNFRFPVERLHYVGQ